MYAGRGRTTIRTIVVLPLPADWLVPDVFLIMLCWPSESEKRTERKC